MEEEEETKAEKMGEEHSTSKTEETPMGKKEQQKMSLQEEHEISKNEKYALTRKKTMFQRADITNSDALIRFGCSIIIVV